jgi:hypothetical protein
MRNSLLSLSLVFTILVLSIPISSQDLHLENGSLLFQSNSPINISTISQVSGDLTFLAPGDINGKFVVKDEGLIWTNNPFQFTSPDESKFVRLSMSNDDVFSINRADATSAVYVDANAKKVGINTALPLTELEVRQSVTPTLTPNAVVSNLGGLTIEDADGSTATMFVDGSDDLAFAFNTIYRAYINDESGAFVNVSDKRLKNNIHPLTSVLSSVMLLNPSTYNFSGYDKPTLCYGFLAQEVEKVFPAFVHDKNGTKGLNYDDFSVIAIKAIQEQQEMIENLKSENARYRDLMSEMNRRIAQLESKGL